MIQYDPIGKIGGVIRMPHSAITISGNEQQKKSAAPREVKNGKIRVLTWRRG